MIPKDITAEHLRGAMRRIRRDGVPRRRRSRGYCLVEDGWHFPPKYTIGLAYEMAMGRPLRADDFLGGQQSNGFLRSRGFCVVECRDCRGMTPGAKAGELVADEPRYSQHVGQEGQKLHPQARVRVASTVEGPPPATRSANDRRIKDRLLEFSKSIKPRDLFPTVVPEAVPIIFSDPFAFLLACSLDRGIKAEVVWTMPYDLAQALGGLSPYLLHNLTTGELDRVIRSLPRKPRYIGDAPRTVKDLAAFVVEDCNGDARRAWEGRTARELRNSMLGIHGVGPGIASMVAVLLESAYGLRFDDLDRRSIDIKPDVHTKRVLYRLGAAAGRDNDVAVDAARRLNPGYPGALDGALWIVGRRSCHEGVPNCEACELVTVCEQVGVR
jgi:endonuclease III